MKFGPTGSVPWDMVVFFSITTVGFGYSVKRIMNPTYAPSASSSQVRSYQTTHDSSHATLDLGCVERRVREAVTSEDGVLRLRGKFCDSPLDAVKESGSVRVRNLTTNTEGTVFFQGDSGSFVTDYLTLKSGRNLIQVEWSDQGGALPRRYIAEVMEK